MSGTCEICAGVKIFGATPSELFLISNSNPAQPDFVRQRWAEGRNSFGVGFARVKPRRTPKIRAAHRYIFSVNAPDIHTAEGGATWHPRRSAEGSSAVSRIGNPPGFGESKRTINAARAEYHSAIQQTTSLRYRDLPLAATMAQVSSCAPRKAFSSRPKGTGPGIELFAPAQPGEEA